ALKDKGVIDSGCSRHMPDKVYKVVKALYGLHQDPRASYKTLANYLLENGFQRGKIDRTLFIKKQKGDILLVQVYVDDIIFGSTNKELSSTPIETEKPLLKDPDGEDVDVHIYIESHVSDKTGLGFDSQVFNCQVFDCEELHNHKSDNRVPKNPKNDSTNKPSKDMSKTHRPEAPIVEDWISDSEDETEIEYVPKQREPSFVPSTEHVKSSREFVKKVKHPTQAANLRTNNQKSRNHKTNWNNIACFVCRSLNHLIKDCGYYEKQMGNLQQALKDKGVIDSGCSRHMPDKVYKVVKALYGLHQDPRASYKTLANYLLENGFQRGKIDRTLFIKKQKGDILLVQVYVDDIIFGSTNKELCKDFEKLMKDKF
nr:putative ribonuclease H-like domain-containing protein [Tanacetum cinerariifolium]